MTSPLDPRPLIVALAGPNGAGKTTFYGAHLKATGLPLVNADDLARQFGIGAYEAAALAERRRESLLSQRKSFAFETVFSDPEGAKLHFLRRAVRCGYTVVLCFIGLDSPAASEERVAMRVLQSGHDVPSEKLAARFARTIKNLRRAIRELPDVRVFDNGDLGDPFRLVARFEWGRPGFLARSLPPWLPWSERAVKVSDSLSPVLIWRNLLDVVRQDGKTYALTWLERMRALDVREGALVLAVPDRFFREWVDDHYRGLLIDALARSGAEGLQVTYEVVEELAPRPSAEATLPAKPPPGRPDRLNERFTFESYVVADSNQLPAAAAAAVADSPGRCYNPLFIYGGIGLGKTHLLHAVGNKIYAKDDTARIVYLSSEEFTNQFVESVRYHRMTEFRRKYREECDILLIDDIHLLGKRPETRKELLYTFNALHEMGKAIVLTSDTVPAEIPGLEKRLRSRFTMGLITDVQEPDFETRIAILKKKAEAERVNLPDRVAQFIARHVQKNVRELEGALVTISAIQSLTGREMTEEFASQVLKDIFPRIRTTRRSRPRARRPRRT